jgi:hypothetical protein
MSATIELPKAFSIRNDQEFFPIQHLMARLNPRLMVVQVATGRHVGGGCTVFWGLVYEEGHPPTAAELRDALEEAGFDDSSGSVQEPPSRALASAAGR